MSTDHCPLDRRSVSDLLLSRQQITTCVSWLSVRSSNHFDVPTQSSRSITPAPSWMPPGLHGASSATCPRRGRYIRPQEPDRRGGPGDLSRDQGFRRFARPYPISWAHLRAEVFACGRLAARGRSGGHEGEVLMGSENQAEKWRVTALLALMLRMPLGLAVIYGLAFVLWYELLR